MSRARTAAAASPSTTRTTAAAGSLVSKPRPVASSASRLALSRARWLSSGPVRRMASAASAAAALGGARPVSKMNGRPASISVPMTSAGPSHRAALAAERLGQRERADHVRVGRDPGRRRGARGRPAPAPRTRAPRPAPAAPRGPGPRGAGRAPGPGPRLREKTVSETTSAYRSGRRARACSTAAGSACGVTSTRAPCARASRQPSISEAWLAASLTISTPSPPWARCPGPLAQDLGQRGHHGQVGQVAGGEHQRLRRPGEGGQLGLQPAVQLGRPGHQPGTGGARAPVPGRGRRRLGQPRVRRQSQVVVGGQVDWPVVAGRPGDQRPAQPGRGPARPRRPAAPPAPPARRSFPRSPLAPVLLACPPFVLPSGPVSKVWRLERSGRGGNDPVGMRLWWCALPN